MGPVVRKLLQHLHPRHHVCALVDVHFRHKAIETPPFCGNDMFRFVNEVLVFGNAMFFWVRRPIKVTQMVKLHGDLAGKEQSFALETAATGKVKVVLATNLAERSITIPDAKIVIDNGLVNVMRYESLQIERTGRDNIMQRRAKLTARPKAFTMCCSRMQYSMHSITPSTPK